MSNEPRGMEHCLFLMNLEEYGTLFISTELRGMEHCFCLMNLEVWNIVYFY